MTDYIQHGDGTVTVVPSKGQTGSSDPAVQRLIDQQNAGITNPLKDTVVGKQQMGYQSQTKIAGAPDPNAGINERIVYTRQAAEAQAVATQPTPQQQPQSYNPLSSAYPKPFLDSRGNYSVQNDLKGTGDLIKVPGYAGLLYNNSSGIFVPEHPARTERNQFEFFTNRPIIETYSGERMFDLQSKVSSIRESIGDWAGSEGWNLPGEGLAKRGIQGIADFGVSTLSLIPASITMIGAEIESPGKTGERLGKTAPAAIIGIPSGIASSYTEPIEKYGLAGGISYDIGMSALILYGAKGAIKGAVTEPFKYFGKTYVPPETIIEPDILAGIKEFPTAQRGTTAGQLITEFKTSEYKLPGTEGKIGGWHATPEEFAKTTETQVGTSEGAGLYLSPSTSPHFWKLGRDFKLFGWDNPPETPAGLWINVKSITRSPVNTRMSIEAQNAFLTDYAPKGNAYVSSAFEQGIKLEKEAIIPPETPLERVSEQFYTKWEGKKVPLMEYKAISSEKPFDITTGGAQTTEPMLANKGINNYGLKDDLSNIKTGGGANLNEFMNIGKSRIEPTILTAGTLFQQQQKTSKEYQEYKTPIISQYSLLSGLMGSERSIKSSIKSEISDPSYIDSLLNSYNLRSGGSSYVSPDYVSSGGGGSSIISPSEYPYRSVSPEGYRGSSIISPSDSIYPSFKLSKLFDDDRGKKKRKKHRRSYFATTRYAPILPPDFGLGELFNEPKKKHRKARKK